MVSISDSRETNNLEDKETLKRYFLREFTVLPSNIREELINLDISKKKLKKLKKELAFLPEEQQNEYIDELYRIYHNLLKGS